jgi:signal transduction histidine kinase/HAMP domain-containing protein
VRFRFRFNSGLRARLFQLVSVALLPALALIIYHASEQRQKAISDAENEALRAARLVAADQRRLIDSSGHLLLALSELPDVRDGDVAGCGALFTQLLDKYRIYANLGVADLSGNIICSGLAQSTVMNIADRRYFQEAIKQKKLAIGEFQIGRITGKASVNLAHPVFGRDHRPIAVVFLSLDLASINQFARMAGLPSDSVLTMIDHNAMILARYPNGGEWVGKRFPEAEMFSTAVFRGEGVAEATGADGQQQLYAFTTIGSPWQRGQILLHVSIPRDFALADANRQLRRNLAALFTVGLLALLAAWYLGDALLVRQLKSLAQTTARIGAGDYSARTGLGRRNNEIDRFAASLDKMASLLEHRHGEAEFAKQRVQRQLERMGALREIDLAISSTLDLREMLRVLLEKTELVLPDAIATIRLYSHNTGDLEPIVCRNLDEDAWRAESARNIQSFERTVLENRIPLTIANVQTDGRAAGHEFATKVGLVSCLCIPLIAAGKLEGLIAFYTRAEHAFDDDEIDFLTTLAGLSAVASHNTRLFDEVRRRESEALAMHALTAAASQSLDLNVTLKEAVSKIAANFRFDTIRIYLYNREMTNLEIKATHEDPTRDQNASIHWDLEESFIGEVAATGEAIVIDDLVNEARYQLLFSDGAKAGSGCRFMALLPLKTKLITWGVAVFADAAARKLTDVESRLLISVSHQIAIAVENANLYEQASTKAKELAALYSFAGLANQSLELNVLLRETAVKILEIFRFDAARVYWRRDDSEHIDLVTHFGFPEEFEPVQHYRLGYGRVGRAMDTGVPMFAGDIRSDEAYQRTAHSRSMLQLGFRGSFLIPIKAGGECLGVMNFLSKRPHSFSQGDLRLIDALIYHLGVAVGNAKLFSEVRQKTIELKEANRAKDEFLGVVSHELRTPLNVIKGYAEVLRTNMFGELNRQQGAAVDKIKNQSSNLLHMINDVLRATTIDAQTVKLVVGDIDLADLLSELRDSYRFANASERAIVWEFGDDWPVLRTDDEKFRAVLQNLINNAIKFTERGVITVSARFAAQDRTVEISVADTGIGIPADKIDNIFGMFQQVDGSATRGYGGVGLGLYIVKNYLDLMGGKIAVESEVGRGAKFVVTLPLEPVVYPISKDREAVLAQTKSSSGVPVFNPLVSL